MNYLKSTSKFCFICEILFKVSDGNCWNIEQKPLNTTYNWLNINLIILEEEQPRKKTKGERKKRKDGELSREKRKGLRNI